MWCKQQQNVHVILNLPKTHKRLINFIIKIQSGKRKTCEVC